MGDLVRSLTLPWRGRIRIRGLTFQIIKERYTHLRLLAARFARVVRAVLPLISEGAGNAGRPMRPPPRVRWWKVKSTRVSQVTPESPGIPRAMVLTASFVLFPATGFVVTVTSRTPPRDLNASIGASEPHDFSVRFRRSRQKRHPRPPHPVPRP
jgi:hypothetical protein